MGLTLAAAAVGWLDAKGYLAKIPTIGGSRAVTMAVAGYAATRFVKNRHVKLAGVAAMVAAGYDFGKTQGGGVSGMEGEDYTSGEGDQGY